MFSGFRLIGFMVFRGSIGFIGFRVCRVHRVCRIYNV